MKTFLKTRLGSARNAEHFQFHSDVLSVITSEFAAAQNLTALRTAYADLFRREDEAFIQSRALEATPEVEEKDRVRDEIFLYLVQTVEASLFCPLADKKAAAQKLQFAIKPYRQAASKPYAENTAQVTNLVTDLQKEENAACLQTLGLADTVTALQTANEEFNAVYGGRSGDKLTRAASDTMKDIRPKVDAAYRQLTEAIVALYKVNEIVTRSDATATALGGVIDSVNAYVLQLQETLARRNAGTKTDISGGTTVNPGTGGGSSTGGGGSTGGGSSTGGGDSTGGGSTGGGDDSMD